MYRISFNNQAYVCSEDSNLLKAARSQMVKVPYACANGGCGLCKVKVTNGNYKMDKYSKAALTDEERSNHYILLCKTHPLSHLETELIEVKEVK